MEVEGVAYYRDDITLMLIEQRIEGLDVAIACAIHGTIPEGTTPVGLVSHQSYLVRAGCVYLRPYRSSIPTR